MTFNLPKELISGEVLPSAAQPADPSPSLGGETPTIPIHPPPSPAISAEPLLPTELLCAHPGCTARAFRRCVRCPNQFCQEHITERRFPDRAFVLPFRCKYCLDTRTDGGVSYVVHTESTGLRPLGHVIYQEYHLAPVYSQAGTDNWVGVISSPCLLTALPDPHDAEETLKEYILRPEKRATLGLREDGVMAVAPNIQASNVQVVMQFRRQQVWRAPDLNEMTEEERALEKEVEDMKKSNAFINARLELFVNGSLWSCLSPQVRGEIKYFQILTEDFFLCVIDAMNKNATIERSIQPVHTRDSFRIRLISVDTPVMMNNGRVATKTVWYFPKHIPPPEYDEREHGARTEHGLPTGVVTYNGVCSPEDLRAIEREADILDLDGRKGKYDSLPNTRHETRKGSKIVRTKYFFGARYLWTAGQKKNKEEAAKASGVRADVAPPPQWMKERVEGRIVAAGLVPAGWLNSYAINFYHDGTEGLHQHFDDKTRFNQPVFSLRLFSDSRLVFGAIGMSMSNPTFFIPMPRGCVTVLEDQGYAANKIKHCIRPLDMTGKSAAVILRQIQPAILAEALQLLMQSAMVKWMTHARGIDDPIPMALRFEREGINMESLVLLTECDLKILGLTLLGPRRVMMNAIEEERARRRLPPRDGCSCECNAMAHELTARMVDPSPVILRNLLVQFPWLARALEPAIPSTAVTSSATSSPLPQVASPCPTYTAEDNFTLPSNAAATERPFQSSFPTSAYSPISHHSYAPQPIPGIARWNYKQPGQPAAPYVGARRGRPPVNRIPLPNFRRSSPPPASPSSSPLSNSSSSPISSSSSNSSISSSSSPLSVSSNLSFSSPSTLTIISEEPMTPLPGEFWLSSSPIAAPSAPLYEVSEAELRKSTEEFRGAKRAAENPLHRTA